jgi:quinohemoprotein ethanol dehydrogenase
VLSTAGGLVFHGRPDGTLRVFASDTGRLIRQIQTGGSIIAAPMTYAVGGRQFVAVMTGLGGAGGFAFEPGSAAYRFGNQNRIMAFALGGGPAPSRAEIVYPPIPEPIAWSASAATVARGRMLYVKNCAACHVFGPGITPDLRRMTPHTHAIFDAIVLEGLYAPNGMGRFDDVLSRSDAHAIHSYVIAQARAAAAQERRDGRAARRR